MKKLVVFLFVFLMAFQMFGCSPEDDSSNKNAGTWNVEDESVMKPFWIGNMIKDESVMLSKSNDDEKAHGNLLFAPEEIVSVYSYDIEKKERVTYKNGEDFEVKGKTIYALNDKMPFMTDAQISGEEYLPGFDYSQIPSTDGNAIYLPFTEGSGFIARQIYVTYSYSEKWDGYTPVYEGEKLSKTIAKLKSKKEFNLFVYGDSISTGANSTSVINVFPYVESWPNAVHGNLEKIFDTKINFLNKSVGGWTSENAIKTTASVGWVGGKQITQTGIEGTLKENPEYKPDLAIIGFGMNDATLGISRDMYKRYIKKIINTIKNRNPDCEFILIGTMLANPKALNQSKGQIEYYKELEAIANETDGVASVNIGAMHSDLLSKGKKYVDMTGNNVNHPNDFMASVYTMNLLSLIVK